MTAHFTTRTRRGVAMRSVPVELVTRWYEPLTASQAVTARMSSLAPPTWLVDAWCGRHPTRPAAIPALLDRASPCGEHWSLRQAGRTRLGRRGQAPRPGRCQPPPC